MSKLWPYLGLAIAVAIGVALAPYIGALLALAVVFLALGFVVLFVRALRDRFMAAGRRWIDYMDREG